MNKLKQYIMRKKQEKIDYEILMHHLEKMDRITSRF